MCHYPEISWLGLLCVWLPLLCSQPVSINQIRADIKGLSKTVITRIEQQQLPSVGVRITELDFIPEELPAVGVGSMDHALHIIQQVLSQLPLDEPLNQIGYDLVNLRSLFNLLASHIGCTRDRSHTDSLAHNLTGISPYSAMAVALHRLQKILQSISNNANDVQSC